MTLSERIQFLIKKQPDKLTGMELAKRLKMPVASVNRLISGKNSDPKSSTLDAIAEYFEISVDQLLGKVPLDTASVHVKKILLPKITDKDSLPLSGEVKSNSYYNHTVDVDSETNTDSINQFAIEITKDIFSPTLPVGTILVVDEEEQPIDGDIVVITTAEHNKLNIKKFYEDDEKIYLFPLNKDLDIIEFKKEKHVINGVVIETRLKLRNRQKEV